MLPFIQSLVFSFSDVSHSQYFYNKLDDSTDYKAYIPKCESLNSFPYRNNLKNVCAKLLKYLESHTISGNTDRYDVCKLLNFWVYRWLFDILKYRDENLAPVAYAELQLIWNDFRDNKLRKTGKETCRPISELAAYDDWRERKELYEYYVNYDSIKQSVEPFPVICKEFYKYVESKKILYEHFKKRCLLNDTNRCPDFYPQCKQYDPEQVLSTISCHNKIKQEGDATAPSAPQIGNGHSVSEPISEEEDGPKKPFDAPILSGKSQTVENLGNVLLGVVATTMTSGALYRFTPLGGMIRNGLGWNTNNMRNFNGGDIRLYDYASEPFNPYPGEEHYIGYQPA